jgi:hypothetical protein
MKHKITGRGFPSHHLTDLVGTAKLFKRERPRESDELSDAPGGARLVAMVSDPTTQLEAILRQIALEIAMAARELASCPSGDLVISGYRDPRQIREFIHALRELQRSLSEAKILLRKSSFDIDSEEAGYQQNACHAYMLEALAATILDPGQARAVEAHYSYLIGQHNEEVCSEIEAIAARK